LNSRQKYPFLICGFERRFDVLGILGLSLVFHVSGVSVFVSAVGDDLSAAIGKSNAVRSSDDFAISVLSVIKIVVGFFVLYAVAEAVRLRGLMNQLT
jgi:hypothetical protein